MDLLYTNVCVQLGVDAVIGITRYYEQTLDLNVAYIIFT